MQKLKIIFFGSGGYTIPTVEELKDQGLEFVFITECEGELVQYLKSNKIPYQTTHLKDKESVKKITRLKPTLGVLASFGAIVPEKVIKLFPLGILNIHPSLLPKFKGPSPIQFTILAGEKETGVTIIRLDTEVDHGPIVAQEKVALSSTETTQELKYQLFAKGAEMISSIIHTLELSRPLHQAQQDHSKESFTKKIERADGEISLDNIPNSEQLDRMIRAYYPWPTVWFRTPINGREKLIKLLPDKKIQVEGKRIMNYRDFINGYPEGYAILTKLNVMP